MLVSVSAVLLIALALARIPWFGALGQGVDETFALLVVVAAMLIVVPWDRLSSFKAAGVEVSLDSAAVKGAIESLEIPAVDLAQLREDLGTIAAQLPSLRGSRILWIDDKPHAILGERRLFRALGAEIVAATTSEAAEATLEENNDFDLIVSDVQRTGESYRLNDGEPIHEGVNFLVKLRSHRDPAIRSLPAILYAAYDWERLVKFTRPARELQTEALICNEISGLMKKATTTIAATRARPIKVPATKVPTGIR